jgi:predicted lysophospholipase L1 biosynthesis ABC-type transport system permease subunit
MQVLSSFSSCRMFIAPYCDRPMALIPSNLTSSQPRLSLLWRLAWRDFQGGLPKFVIFLACLALGLGAIIGVGSIGHALSDGLSQKGSVLLGGDVSLDLVQREASDAERRFMAQHGTISEAALMRAMARVENGETALVEIKAVDETACQSSNHARRA